MASRISVTAMISAVSASEAADVLLQMSAGLFVLDRCLAVLFDHEVISCPLSLPGWALTCLVGHLRGHLRSFSVACDSMSILSAWLGTRVPGWATAWTSTYHLGCL